MKRNFALLTAFLLMISLFAGCGGGGSTSSPAPSAPPPAAGSSPAEPAPPPAAAEPGKLVIAARGGLHVDAMMAVKDQFEADNNCTVEILGLEADDLKQKVSLDSTNAKGAYDLAMADDPWMPEWLEAGIYENLNAMGLADDSDFIPASLALGKDPYGAGDTYALPFAGNVQLLFYNKQLFEDNKLEVPTDWESLLAACNTIKAGGSWAMSSGDSKVTPL